MFSDLFFAVVFGTLTARLLEKILTALIAAYRDSRKQKSGMNDE